ENVLGLRGFVREFDRTVGCRPAHLPELERADASGNPIGRVDPGAFVGYRIAEIAAVPPESGPLVPDDGVAFMNTRPGCPVDGAALEMIEPADAVGRASLVGDRIAEEARLPAKCGPFVADSAMDFVSAGLRGPVDRAMLEVVHPALAVREG